MVFTMQIKDTCDMIQTFISSAVAAPCRPQVAWSRAICTEANVFMASSESMVEISLVKHSTSGVRFKF